LIVRPVSNKWFCAISDLCVQPDRTDGKSFGHAILKG
jgi:hypothetical protein